MNEEPKWRQVATDPPDITKYEYVLVYYRKECPHLGVSEIYDVVVAIQDRFWMGRVFTTSALKESSGAIRWAPVKMK